MTPTSRPVTFWLSAVLAMAPGLTQAQPSTPAEQSSPDTSLAGTAGMLPTVPMIGNNVTTVQSGTANQAFSTVTGAANGGGNSLSLLQIGNGNSAQAAQYGQGNSLAQTQIGTNNPMAATQVGTGNALIEQQFGNSTTGITATQTGGARATVIQIR